jgi:anti-sigma B factor antagonist
MIRQTTEERNGAVVLDVAGEIDLECSPAFRDNLFGAFRRKPAAVIVHLAEVAYMDSSGVAILVEGIQESRRTGIPLRLAAPSATVRGILDLARLTQYFDIRPSVESAL